MTTIAYFSFVAEPRHPLGHRHGGQDRVDREGDVGELDRDDRRPEPPSEPPAPAPRPRPPARPDVRDGQVQQIDARRRPSDTRSRAAPSPAGRPPAGRRTPPRSRTAGRASAAAWGGAGPSSPAPGRCRRSSSPSRKTSQRTVSETIGRSVTARPHMPRELLRSSSPIRVTEGSTSRPTRRGADTLTQPRGPGHSLGSTPRPWTKCL